jgi:hypothetical protein
MDGRGSETTEKLKPWRRALREARVLPHRLRVRVLDRALSRFASIYRDVLMRPPGASGVILRRTIRGLCSRAKYSIELGDRDRYVRGGSGSTIVRRRRQLSWPVSDNYLGR